MTDSPLANLTRRELEELRAKIDKELQLCIIDQREGAVAYRVTGYRIAASLMLCKPCFEKYRLPEARSEPL